MRRMVPAALFVVVIAARGALAQGAWQFEVVPYLWQSSIDGREGVGGAVENVSASFKDLVDFVNVGGSLRLIARRPPLGWYAEASYVQLGDDVSTSLGTVRVKSDAVFGEAGLSYDLAHAFSVYGGLRYQQSDLSIENPNSRFSENQGWVDAVAGVQWTPVLSDRWVAWMRADAGAGSSDLVWLAEAGAGYRWGTRWGAYLSYRLLDTDYRNGSFVYDVRQQGLLLGFGIRF